MATSLAQQWRPPSIAPRGPTQPTRCGGVSLWWFVPFGLVLLLPSLRLMSRFAAYLLLWLPGQPIQRAVRPVRTIRATVAAASQGAGVARVPHSRQARQWRLRHSGGALRETVIRPIPAREDRWLAV